MSIFKSIKEITINSLTNTTDFIRGTTSTFTEVITDNSITEKLSNIKEKGKQTRLLNQTHKLKKKQEKIQKKLTKLLTAQIELDVEKMLNNNN